MNVRPYPATIPVISLRIFVDSLIFKNCMNQSKNITRQKRILTEYPNLKNGYKTNDVISPINTPVHRAHTGNCLPL